MKARIMAMICMCQVGLFGCSTTRILNQPYKTGENAVVLIVCTENENPPALVETGQDGYRQPIYSSFYDWIYNAFSKHYSGPGVYLFEPNVVNAFVRRHEVTPKSGYTTTVGGGPMPMYREQYHFGFADSDLPGLFAAGIELGATHIVKVKCVNFKRDYYHAVSDTTSPNGVHSHSESDNTRINVAIQATVFSVARQEMLYQRTFEASDDRFSIMSSFVGNHNVQKSLAQDVLHAIVEAEAEYQRSSAY